MKKLMSVVAILFFATSAGMTMARADGGETGSDRSHTSAYGAYGYYSYYGYGRP